MTSYRGRESYPLAARDDLLEAFPSLARKFPTYRSLGAGRIEDLFPRDRLDDARVLEVTTLASMVALGLGGRRFELHELPLQAQYAPVHAILIDDFDGDGRMDVILGENFYGVPPVRGRYDAGYGTLLTGNGDGAFTAVEPRESGLWLHGEIRNLAYVRAPGGIRLIVAARNDDTLQFFVRRKAKADETSAPPPI